MWSPPTARLKGGQRCEDPRASPDCFYFSCAAVSGSQRESVLESVLIQWARWTTSRGSRRWACRRPWGCSPWWTRRSARAPCTSPTSSSTNSTTASTPILLGVRNPILAPLLTPLPAFFYFLLLSHVRSSSIVRIQDQVAVWFLVLLTTYRFRHL